MNFHNNQTWAEENPHAVIENNYQQQFSLNVWVGIVGDYIGPYFLPPRLNGQEYRHFLEFLLSELLENVPLEERGAMWLMHDGALCFNIIVGRKFLDETYGENWTGRAGLQSWPPRSPDIT